MDYILNWLANNLTKVIGVPVVVNSMSFLALLFQSLSDGVIDETELHNLLTAGSGIDLIVLVFVMAVMKVRSKN